MQVAKMPEKMNEPPPKRKQMGASVHRTVENEPASPPKKGGKKGKKGKKGKGKKPSNKQVLTPFIIII